VALFALSAVAHLFKGQHLAVNASLGMVVALVVSQNRFQAPPDPPSLLRLVRFVPTYLGAVLLFGVASLYVERGGLAPRFTVADSVSTVFCGLIGLDGNYDYVRPRFEEFFTDALLALGVVGLAVFAVLVFRPLRARDRTPRPTGSTPCAWCTPTGGTRWPTSRCATTRASSSARTARPCSPTPTPADTRWWPATRSVAPESVARAARRVPRHVRRARVEPRVPRHPAVRLPQLRRARVPRLLPRRRGHPAVRRVRPGGRTQERPGGGASGRAGLPVPAARRIGRVPGTGAATERDQRALARQGPGAGFHDVAEPGHPGRRRQPGVPALRRARRSTTGRAVFFGWSPPMATTPATPWT